MGRHLPSLRRVSSDSTRLLRRGRSCQALVPSIPGVLLTCYWRCGVHKFSSWFGAWRDMPHRYSMRAFHFEIARMWPCYWCHWCANTLHCKRYTGMRNVVGHRLVSGGIATSAKLDGQQYSTPYVGQVDPTSAIWICFRKSQCTTRAAALLWHGFCMPHRWMQLLYLL